MTYTSIYMYIIVVIYVIFGGIFTIFRGLEKSSTGRKLVKLSEKPPLNSTQMHLDRVLNFVRLVRSYDTHDSTLAS